LVAPGIELGFFGSVARNSDHQIIEESVGRHYLLKLIKRNRTKVTDWIHLAEDRKEWRAIVNMIMELQERISDFSRTSIP
jgi:hypothetical protein